MPLSNRAIIWAVANVSGIAIYLRNSVALWPTPEDQGFPGGPGDGLYWLLCVAPFLFLFAIVNATALIHLIRTRRSSSMHRFFAWLLIVFVWFLTVAYSEHRSRHVSPEYSVLNANSHAA
ncbi:MAG: hypothetical protein Q7T36_03485 [Fluviicoccus sp.]|uniref:hypothetical protein n=1 Tax=Fluviicoccus sp. TaxID=2003552 RepID=UPI00271B70EB|nr:hypothetical protein [Fluviicoccus sp.]MDO8329511.1 hypothetical protein [Fluviicoccus sp.]